MSNVSLKKDLHDLERVGGRSGSDTIKLWESYRDQAYLWRALSLLQMPATFLAIFLSIVLYFTRDEIIEVPAMPQPGFYSVKKLPDSHFISFGEDIINLIATYQPASAKRQFQSAREFLWEPALSNFDNDFMPNEVRTILETSRSQLFLVHRDLRNVERNKDQDHVIVRLVGEQVKYIGQNLLSPEYVVFYLKMTTIPRNKHNNYGIVIQDIRKETLSKDQFDRINKGVTNTRFVSKEAQ